MTTRHLEVAVHRASSIRAQGWERWDELLATSASVNSFFGSSTWIRAWTETYGAGAEHVVLEASEHGAVVGMAGLTRLSDRLYGRVPLSVAKVVLTGTGPGGADHAGFACADDPEIVEGLWRATVAWAGSRPIELSSLPASSPLRRVVAGEGTPVASQPIPQAVIPPDSTFAQVESTWTKNRRRDLRKKHRRFGEEGGTFQWIDDPERVLAQLEDVFALHELRRAVKGTTTFGTSDVGRRFHRRLAELATERSHPWIQLALVDDAPVGALYGFRFDQIYSIYQSGWAPEWSGVSIGLIQYASALRHVAEAGGRLFDMCRGDDPYKLRFATRTEQEETVLIGRSPASAALRARWGLRRRRASDTVPQEPADDADPSPTE